MRAIKSGLCNRCGLGGPGEAMRPLRVRYYESNGLWLCRMCEDEMARDIIAHVQDWQELKDFGRKVFAPCRD